MVTQDEALSQLKAISEGHSRQCISVTANADVCTCDASASPPIVDDVDPTLFDTPTAE